jgi:hypothetical protein
VPPSFSLQLKTDDSRRYRFLRNIGCTTLVGFKTTLSCCIDHKQRLQAVPFSSFRFLAAPTTCSETSNSDSTLSQDQESGVNVNSWMLSENCYDALTNPTSHFSQFEQL